MSLVVDPLGAMPWPQQGRKHFFEIFKNYVQSQATMVNTVTADQNQVEVKVLMARYLVVDVQSPGTDSLPLGGEKQK